MRALVIHQPWAWAIVAGHKRFENRSWTTRYRGPVIIVAGASRASLDFGTAFIERLGIEVPDALPRGCIVGMADLVDVLPVEEIDDHFATGPFCWQFENAASLDPIPHRGRLGLYSISPSDLAASGLGGPQ